MPLGATLGRRGINFAIFSEHSTRVSLLLYLPGRVEPFFKYDLDPRFNRTGNIWHVFVRGAIPGIEYGYRLDREPNNAPHIHRYNFDLVLLDPYGYSVSGGEVWGDATPTSDYMAVGGHVGPRRSMVVDYDFDWEEDQPLNIPLSEAIIYELHVRGFTMHKSSGVKHPGTFAGLVEKIPYLKELGVTSVELLPVNEFEERDPNRINPLTGERLLNYWGYQPLSFFAPNAAYAHDNSRGAQVIEFKSMVKALHKAGIEVILDVVFNHTAEGNENGPTTSFRGIDNQVYYLIDRETGDYLNYSGCGNTLNCNHPVVRDMILDCLRYWVMEMHIDGFRFDLASILGRGRDGEVLPNPPLIERIAADPVLANTKLIAEAWDAGGLYQVGTFPAWGRWAEWNGRFRDDIRRFVRGDPGMVSKVASRLIGSPDIYRTSGRNPYHSINFITCHDGFTLADLVSYNHKRNEANGEDNRDGADENLSWNCGVEGPVEESGLDAAEADKIKKLRQRQMKNFAAILLASGGAPMLMAGDEFGRTQRGNNNAYCQDNELSWIDWSLAEKNADLLRIFKLLIKFRKSHPAFREGSFVSPDKGGVFYTVWHGVRKNSPDWSYGSRSIAVQVRENVPDGRSRHPEIYAAINAYWEPLDFELPDLPEGWRWRRKLDTSLDSPHDIVHEGSEPCIDAELYTVQPRSVILLLGKSARGKGEGNE